MIENIDNSTNRVKKVYKQESINGSGGNTYGGNNEENIQKNTED